MIRNYFTSSFFSHYDHSFTELSFSSSLARIRLFPHSNLGNKKEWFCLDYVIALHDMFSIRCYVESKNELQGNLA